jgi:hypothetical protein
MSIITVITLTKDNLEDFERTARSVCDQQTIYTVYWIVADGSSPSIGSLIREAAVKCCSKASFSIDLRYESTRKKNIHGIYPSFNYSTRLLKGDAVIYLNSGDSFCQRTSLDTLCKLFFLHDARVNKLVFGRAVINTPYGLKWFFPGCSPSAIYPWLEFFEPNHQAMLVSSALAINIPYDTNLPSSADKIWKRTVLESADLVLFCPVPVVDFFLGGISSTPMRGKYLLAELSHPSSSTFSKFLLLLKSLLPANLLNAYYILMMCKSFALDCYFSLIVKMVALRQAFLSR